MKVYNARVGIRRATIRNKLYLESATRTFKTITIQKPPFNSQGIRNQHKIRESAEFIVKILDPVKIIGIGGCCEKMARVGGFAYTYKESLMDRNVILR